MRIRTLILAGTAFTPLLLGTAIGQTPEPVAAPQGPGSQLFPPATPGFSPATQPTYSPTDVGRVRANDTATGVTRKDIGGGLMIDEDAPKARSTVTRDFIQKQTPTANPYSAIRLLPGANVSLNDPYGLNGGNITVRGFNSDQLGLTVNGVPVNDSGNFAVFPQEYVDAENLRQIVLTPGSADLDAPHVGASGGTINTYQIDPKDEAGGFLGVSYGSYNAVRIFARGETGLIGRTKAYISVSHFSADHFRGPGTDDRNHVDVAVNTQIGDNSKIAFYLNYNDAVNNNYVNPSLAQIAQFGGNARKVSYYDKYVFAAPVGGVVNQSTLLGAPVSGATSFAGVANYYGLRINPFRNAIASAPSTFALTDTVSLDVTPYLWYGFGNGGGATTITEGNSYFSGIGIKQPVRDLNGNGNTKDVLAYYNPSITETIRPGIQTKVNWQLDNNRISAGYHFEFASHRQTATLGQIDPNGEPNDIFGQNNNLTNVDGRRLYTRNTLTRTYTNQFFVGDTSTFFNDRLAVDVGLRQAFVNRNVNNYITGLTPNTQIFSSQTLPSAAVRFKLNDRNQLFASYSNGYRVPSNFTLIDTLNINTGAVNVRNRSDQQVETTTNFEVGHRYQGPIFNTSLTFFASNFRNRQVSSNAVDPNSGSLYSTNINAGQQENRGIDFEVGFRAWNNFRPYVSAEYLHAENRSNYPVYFLSGGKATFDQLATKGKLAVRSPEFQGAVGLDYDDGTFFGNAAVKYIGHQYSSFANDEQIPHIVTGDLTLGYRLQQDIWKAKKPELKVNFINITDEKFLSGVSSIQTSSKAQVGTKGNAIPLQGTPLYYVGGGFAVIATLSSAF